MDIAVRGILTWSFTVSTLPGFGFGETKRYGSAAGLLNSITSKAGKGGGEMLLKGE